jgi:hypothetical protein
MKPLLLLSAFIAAISGATTVVIHREDLVGTWSDTSCAEYKGELYLRADGSFLTTCADQVDGGKWVFHPPAMLEFISWSDPMKGTVSKDSQRRFDRIEAFAPHRMILAIGRYRTVMLKQ